MPLDGITDVRVCCDVAETPAPLMVVLIDYAGDVIGTAPFMLQYLPLVGIPFDMPLTGSVVRVRFVVTQSNEHMRKMFGLSPLHRSTHTDLSRPVSLIEKETFSSNAKVPNKRVHPLSIRFASYNSECRCKNEIYSVYLFANSLLSTVPLIVNLNYLMGQVNPMKPYL